MRLPGCFLLMACLIILQACRHNAAADMAFGFHPDSSKVYNITWVQQTESGWIYNKLPQKTVRLEKITMRMQWVGGTKKDSLYLLKLAFEGYRTGRPPVWIRDDNDMAAYTPVPAKSEVDEHNYEQALQYQLSLLNGQWLYAWMNKRGEVLRVVGFDNLADSVAAFSGIDRRTMAYTLKEYVGEDIMRDRLTRLFSFVPGRPKVAGQNWVIDQMLLRGAPVMLSNMYVMKALQDDTACISIAGAVSARQGEQGRTYMKGRLAGAITAGYASGIPYRYSDTSTTVTTTDAYDMTARQTVTVTIVPAAIK